VHYFRKLIIEESCEKSIREEEVKEVLRKIGSPFILEKMKIDNLKFIPLRLKNKYNAGKKNSSKNFQQKQEELFLISKSLKSEFIAINLFISYTKQSIYTFSLIYLLSSRMKNKCWKVLSQKTILANKLLRSMWMILRETKRDVLYFD